ncbi:MAG: hypothetical protein HY300_04795, partial [Verrucomicrobia bacterium]|nr:hypothetical protein [Verrucomicrobiota bacterium]
ASATPNTNLTESERFVAFRLTSPTLPGASVSTTGALSAPPTARLNGYASGEAINPSQLNNTRYIDITFVSRSDDNVLESSINGDEITLSGSGVGDAQLKAGAPLKVSGNTYRYFFVDRDPTNDPAANPLFQNGEVKITFTGGRFAAGTVTNLEFSETLVLASTKAAATSSTTTISLGPVVLINPSVGIAGFAFKDGKLILTISIGVDSGSLNFGGSGNSSTTGGAQSGSGVSAVLTNLQATFDLAIGLPGNFSLSATGKFSVFVSGLTVDVPDVVHVEASNIRVQYDPAGADTQELVRIDSATISFPKVHLAGQISPYNTGTEVLPGLVVRRDGFKLGQAEIIYGGTVTAGSTAATNTTPNAAANDPIRIGPLTFNDIRVGVTNFEVLFNGSNPFAGFNGSIFFASGGASLTLGSAFTASVTARAGSATGEALRVDLQFENGRVKGVVFMADTLTLTFGSSHFLTLTAKDFTIDSSKAGTDDAFAIFGDRSEQELRRHHQHRRRGRQQLQVAGLAAHSHHQHRPALV